jgi:hypothetical protein
MAALKNLLQIVLPKAKAPKGGLAYTNTFNPSATGQVLSRPAARDHLNDIFNDRINNDARTLIKTLFRSDPDMSATVHAYLTVANTEPWFMVYDTSNKVDRPGMETVSQILNLLFTRTDYTQPAPFAIRQSLRAVFSDLRYMLLLRGAIGAELVFDKMLRPFEIRNVDMGTVEWQESASGVYLPSQRPANSNDPIDLNIPSFFVSFYRRDPTNIYNDSPFVSSINTIAARQQVINDLYRLMRITGYPRIDIKVLEEVLRKNAPMDVQQDEQAMRTWMAARLQEIGDAVGNLRPDQAITHFDSVEMSILNSGGPSKSMDVTEVMKVLNAQNQASLKVVSTVIGRGESGVNTASVEARIFSLSAEELNYPVADLMSQLLTFALRMTGSESRVEFGFSPVELRPWTELEPQLLVKQDRLLKLLSYGIITDDDFHMEMFSRPRPDGVEEFSGTRFYQGTEDMSQISPNSDPLGRSAAAKGGSGAARRPEVSKSKPSKGK